MGTMAAVAQVGGYVDGLLPPLGSLWQQLWPAVTIFLSLLLLRSYISVRERESPATLGKLNPVEQLWAGVKEALERLFLWTDKPIHEWFVPARFVGLVLGRWYQFGWFGKWGRRISRRARAIFSGLPTRLQAIVLLGGGVVAWVSFVGWKAAEAVTLLTGYDPTAWGAVAAATVGVIGYVEPLLTAFPRVEPFIGPEMAIYAFLVTFAAIWAIDAFIWWRLLNNSPILRWLDEVLGS